MTCGKIHSHFHRVERTDPITGHTLNHTAGQPWVQEGDADEGLRIYFDSEESRRSYEAIPTVNPQAADIVERIPRWWVPAAVAPETMRAQVGVLRRHRAPDGKMIYAGPGAAGRVQSNQ